MRRLLHSRFVRNAATLQIGTVLTSAGNITTSVVLAHVLGAEAQGSYIVATQLFAFTFFLASLGIMQLAVTQIASASARGNPQVVAEWMGFQVKVYLIIGALLIGAGAYLLPLAARLWHGVHELVDPAVGWWAWWLTGTVLLDIPRAVTTSALQGSRRMLLLAQLENGTELARVFLVVVGAVVAQDPRGPVLGTLAASLVSAFLAADIYRRARRTAGYPMPSLLAVFRAVPRVPLLQGLRPAVKFGALRQLDAMVSILPPLIIQSFASSSWVTYFQIAQRILNLPRMLMAGVSRTLLPTLSELQSLKLEERFRGTFYRATLYGGGFVAAGIVLTLPLVPFAVSLLYPASFVEPVWGIALILSIAYVLSCFGLSLDSFYLLTNQIGRAIFINSTLTVVGLTGMVLLCRTWPHHGGAWALVAMHGLGSLVNYTYILWWFHRRRGRTLERTRTA